MISEISQNVVGMISSQAKEGAGGPGRLQKSAEVAEPKTIETLAENIVQREDAGTSVSPNKQELEEAVENLNQFAQSVRRQLEFTVDQDSGKTIIRVIDSETGDTIRNIPPEEIVNMQKHLKETSEMLFHKSESGLSLLFQDKA